MRNDPIISAYAKKREKTNLPDFRAGDTVIVHQKVQEGKKERIQAFEGLVLARKHGRGLNATFTVRKMSGGIGVERIFPLHATFVDKIQVVKKADKIKRAKLYYLRERGGKGAKIKSSLVPEEMIIKNVEAVPDGVKTEPEKEKTKNK